VTAMPALPAPFVERLHAATPRSEIKSLPDSEAVEAFKKLPPALQARVMAWASSALLRECEKVAAAKEGTRNKTLFDAACRLHELANTGLLDGEEVDAKLREAAQRCGL